MAPLGPIVATPVKLPTLQYILIASKFRKQTPSSHTEERKHCMLVKFPSHN